MAEFPEGITVGGVPIMGASIPAITGDYFHVCPGSSTIVNYKGKQVVSSSGNSGESLAAPLDSIATAYTKCTSGAGDGIILWSYGTSTAMTTSYLTSAITWSKHGITTIGMGAPVMTSQRARVANASTATTLANLITVSGNNNTFLNAQFGNWGSGAAALGGVDVTGLRNYFSRCHIVGAGSTTPAQTTGSYSLQLTGATDNTFEECVIGTDTVDADGSQAVTGVLKLGSDCQANFFTRCRFISGYSYASSTCGMIHIVGAGQGISRTHEFRDCSFVNYKTGAPMTTPPLCVVVGTAPNNGVIWMTGNSDYLGYAAWAAASYGRVFVTRPAAATTGGLSVVSPS